MKINRYTFKRNLKLKKKEKRRRKARVFTNLTGVLNCPLKTRLIANGMLFHINNPQLKESRLIHWNLNKQIHVCT